MNSLSPKISGRSVSFGRGPRACLVLSPVAAGVPSAVPYVPLKYSRLEWSVDRSIQIVCVVLERSN